MPKNIGMVLSCALSNSTGDYQEKHKKKEIIHDGARCLMVHLFVWEMIALSLQMQSVPKEAKEYIYIYIYICVCVCVCV